jgi:hypothetical protein
MTNSSEPNGVGSFTVTMAMAVIMTVTSSQGRMARGGQTGQGIHKVSPGPAMTDPSTPCGRATAETAVSKVARPQGGRPAAVFYAIGYQMPYAYASSSTLCAEMSWF